MNAVYLESLETKYNFHTSLFLNLKLKPFIRNEIKYLDLTRTNLTSLEAILYGND